MNKNTNKKFRNKSTKIRSKNKAGTDIHVGCCAFSPDTYVALCKSNLWQLWMWNMRSPPFRYSMTKNRFSWTHKCREVRPVVC